MDGDEPSPTLARMQERLGGAGRFLVLVVLVSAVMGVSVWSLDRCMLRPTSEG